MKKKYFLMTKKLFFCLSLGSLWFSSQCLLADPVCLTIQNNTEGHFSVLSDQNRKSIGGGPFLLMPQTMVHGLPALI